MLKGNGKFRIADGIAYDRELRECIKKLQSKKDNEYIFVIMDNTKNRSLGNLKYLFAVLKRISDGLPDHPTVDQLYRYFSDIFAPVHCCTINNESYEYYDLKSERSVDLGIVNEKIIQYAQKHWGITVPTIEELRDPEHAELYAAAHEDLLEQWSEFLPHKNN